MSLPWKVRAMLRAQAVLTRARLMPTHEKVLGMPEAKRMALGASKALIGPVPTVDTQDHLVTTRDGKTIRVRTYRPTAASDQPVLFVHGGGFVVGGLDSCDHICRRLADESHAVVVSVEYRLAPVHQFPIPLHDCADAADWLLARTDELGVDPAKLVIAGDSGGGNLAAALAVVFRDLGRPLAGQLLIYPATDLAMSLPGINAYEGVGLTTEACRLCVNAYLGDHDPKDPYASPLYADPTGLAPAFVLTVDHDPLKHEGEAYVGKLRDAGIPVQHVNIADHVHGSLSIPKLYKGIDELYVQMTSFVRSVGAGQVA